MAFPIGNTVLPGYTMPVGEKYELMFDHTGPTSYTQFSSPSTGGDVINASDLGFGGFDEVEADMADVSGQFIAYVVPLNGGYGNAVPKVVVVWYSLVTATLGGQSQTAGAQVAASTNLSTFSLRIRARAV